MGIARGRRDLTRTWPALTVTEFDSKNRSHLDTAIEFFLINFENTVLHTATRGPIWGV